MVPIKLLHVTSSLTSTGAGVKEVVYQLSSRQSLEKGMDCSVAGLIDPRWKDESLSWGNMSVFPHKVFGPKSFGYAPDLVKTILRLNPDMVHLHGLWMYPSKAVLDWHFITGKPYIVSLHGMLSDVALSYSKFKKHVAAKLFQRDVFDQASALHVTTNFELENVISFGLKNRIVNIPNGVVVSDFTDYIDSQPKKILALGRIHKIKGLDNLLLAWERLQVLFPDWCLEIAGSGDARELNRLTQLVVDRNLNRVCFTPWVSGTAKICKFQSASVFVLPSLSENFAITVAESLGCGVPVVCSMGAPWGDLEKFGCGRWVDIGVDPLVQGLSDLMGLTSTERRLMGARGRAWMVNSFSWDKIVNDFEVAYRSLI